jgi:crotonobetainyl-CoA:carnitine CoA-transferase CaiB-like acyl-CoA transferase
MTSVLAGLNVLDLSRGVAGPIATMLLADNGATVTRIEAPDVDPFASWPGSRVWARGKRSAVLDLKNSTERAQFLALASRADVVVESFRPGVTARLAIDYDVLSARNPRLIYCSITGYGRGNRHSDRPAYDALVAARLGLQLEQRSWPGGPIDHIHGLEPPVPDLEVPPGCAPGSPRSGPIFSYSTWPSLATAYLATTGINAALLARETTGRGQWVETSLLQGAMALTMGKWMRVENPYATGFRMWITDSRAPKGHFECADGRWIQQWVPNPMFVLSSSDGDTLESRRGISNVRNDPDRVGNDPENVLVLAHYYPEMAAAMKRFPSTEWVRVARDYGTPLQQIRTPEEALCDQALIDEGVVVDVDDPDLGRVRQVGLVYRLHETPGRVQGAAPRKGQHSDTVKSEAAAIEGAKATMPLASAHTAPHAAPLAGVIVIDLGFAVAGPFGTQVLGDLGATVIKVNALRDPWWHCTHIAMGANRGKRSIGINLKTAAGMAVLHRLVERADVVHSNMRYKAALRLGVDEVSMRAINPALIYCHTRGFEDGPRSDSPANDQTGNALSGTQYEDGGMSDGGVPFWSLTSMGDTGNGFLSAIGVIQALYHRRRTGIGQRVDTSIINAGMLTTSYAALDADGNGLPRPRLDGMQRGISALYRLYETADGWLCLAAVTEAHWHALVGALGHAELSSDARFATPQSRSANDPALIAALDGVFAAKSASDWFSLLDEHGVPCEISDEEFADHFFDDAEMIAARRVVTYDHPELGRFDHAGLQIDFSDTPGRVWGPPPLVGQHTREIMREFGFADDDIDALCAEKAVFETMSVND